MQAALGRGHAFDFGLKWSELGCSVSAALCLESFSPEEGSGQCRTSALFVIPPFVISHSRPPSKCLLSKDMKSLWPFPPHPQVLPSFMSQGLASLQSVLQLVHPCSFSLLRLELILPKQSQMMFLQCSHSHSVTNQAFHDPFPLLFKTPGFLVHSLATTAMSLSFPASLAFPVCYHYTFFFLCRPGYKANRYLPYQYKWLGQGYPVRKELQCLGKSIDICWSLSFGSISVEKINAL